MDNSSLRQANAACLSGLADRMEAGNLSAVDAWEVAREYEQSVADVA